MAADFGTFPKEVVDFVRKVFRNANAKVSGTLTANPGLHEEGLDQLLVTELSATPPVFLSKAKAQILVESHWLGGRRMFGRWEIADIAIFILISRRGQPANRKVALLQTKRLYAREFSGGEIDYDDYRIGVGRLVENLPAFPYSTQRTFRFSKTSVYGALLADSQQVTHVDAYVREKDISVYYGLYNPMVVPHARKYPSTQPVGLPTVNVVGTRIVPSPDVHGVLRSLTKRKTPTFADLTFGKRFDSVDADSIHGWRLERFIADEVMKCAQGKLFPAGQDPSLEELLYRRSAPLAAAIAISIDLLAD